MKKANNTPPTLGSAIYAAKRAADIVFILQNKGYSNDGELMTQINKTLQIYGEQNPELSIADLEELKVVSQKIHTVFATKDINVAASHLNMLLRQYTNAPRLSAHGATSWHLHVDSNDHAPWAEWFAASSVLALATLLTEKQHNPGGLCASSSCGRPYIDTGKGGGRNYCSPRCATRERVAAYRRMKLRKQESSGE